MVDVNGLVLRAGVPDRLEDRVHLAVDHRQLTASDQKEFAANDLYERTRDGLDGQLLFEELLDRADFIRTFLALRDQLALPASGTVLELGASHGWASALIKWQRPDLAVVASDLVPQTLRHVERYERLFGITLDQLWAVNARDMPFESEQFEAIFTFAAFHHFGVGGDFLPACAEIVRLLKVGGTLTLLYEPAAPQWVRFLARQRANRKRSAEQVDEDVLPTRALAQTFGELGCEVRAEPCPFARFRSPIAGAYYTVIEHLWPLRHVLPCTLNLTAKRIR